MSSEPRTFQVRVETAGGPAAVSARLFAPDGHGRGDWLILAHGAGAGQDHPFMVSFARALAARGLHTVTFNFPYIERRRRVPDPNSTLEACWRDVLAAVGDEAGRSRVFIGGKSMGGRIASQVAATGKAQVAPTGNGGSARAGAGSLSVSSRATRPGTARDPAGLVFLGYPLHPPGRPEQLRVAHWSDIHVPALFVQGMRDTFGSADEVRAHLGRFGADAKLLPIEEGDHSFKVPRKGGRSQDAVYEQIQDAIVEWISRTHSEA